MDVREAFESGTLMHPVTDEPSTVDLIRSLARLSGFRDFPERSEGAALRELIGPADHYLLVLVDGLGMNQQNAFPDGGFFRSAFSRSLRSVFPSTTAVALTSIATGAWPGEHGVAGWWTYFPERRRIIAPLLARERYTDTPIERLGLSLADLIGIDPLAPALFRTCQAFYPARIGAAPYARWSRGGTSIHTYRTVPSAGRRVRRTLRRSPGPTLTYLYLPSVDSVSHKLGIDANETRSEIQKVDRMLARLRERLPHNVRMVLTADHGLANVDPQARFVWNDQDPVMSCLVCPPTAEQTLPVFHVVAGKEAEFEDRFRATDAASVFSLVPSADLLDLGVLGPEDVQPAAAARYGTYIGVSSRVATLETVHPGKDPLVHTAVHGGLRPDEISIPLFLA